MWSRRRSLLAASIAVALALLAWAGVGSTFGAFRDTTTNSGNSFSAAADWVGCSASGTVIAKTTGYAPGYLMQGGTYYVYANISDSGNPPSGIASATTDVSSVDSSGAAAVALVSGAYSVGGVSYNHRSASRTVKNPLAGGSYTFSIACTDNGGISGTQTGFSVTVDNSAPSASDVQTANGGSIVGRPQLGDTVTFTYSEPIDPDSILSSWTGASTGVVVRINNVAGGDILQVWNAANSAQLPLGQINLGRTDYVNANRTYGGSGTASAMVQSGAAITITLGTASGAGTTASGNGTMIWIPSGTATDRAGNACSLVLATESGAADKEF